MHSLPTSRNAHRSSLLIRATITVLSLALSTCKESLPVYHAPANMFQARLTPFYGLTASENKLHIFVVVQNIFDETLEGEASINGRVQLVSTADPNVVKTFTLGPGNILHAPGYHPGTGMLTFNARDTIIFDASWDLGQRPLLDDAGKDLTAGLLHLGTDPACPMDRTISDPQNFSVEGFVQLFDRSGPSVAGKVVFRFCLISNWVNPKYCPYVTAPCNEILSRSN
jgi:hypothetical protein